MTSEAKTPGYILYGGGVTRALGPQMVLEEGNIPYELRVIDELKGEHRSRDYLAINPAGYIPALATPDGDVLHEAAAIMIHLAEHHRLADLMPPPGDRRRGLFFCRIFYQTNDIQPAVRQFFKPTRYSTEAEHASGIKRQAHSTAMDRWSVLDRLLESDGPYNLGDRFSLADLYMALWAAYGLEGPDTVLEAFPAVRRCFELTAGRPKIGPLLEGLRDAMTVWREGRTP